MVSSGYAANLMALGSNVQQTRHMQLIKSPRGGYSEFCPLLDTLAFLCLVTLVLVSLQVVQRNPFL